MEDLQNIALGAKALFLGGLVVGDHDSITAFGVDQQSTLRNCTRKMSQLLGCDREGVDEVIGSCLQEMNEFERDSGPRLSIFGQRKSKQRNFDDLCSCIERTSSWLEVQHAQVVKEIETLDRIDASLQRCGAELDNKIDEGQCMLETRPSDSTDDADAPDTDAWYSRLDKRIEELSLSKLVVQQSRAQIKTLHNNDLAILDHISSFIFNLASLCQTQLAGEKGYELYRERIKMCEMNLRSVNLQMDSDGQSGR